jgi:hypothetical protein
MQRLAVVSAFAVAILGCASLGSLTPSSTTHAMIDDVTGGPPLVAGHCIAQVDGQPVVRAEGRMITYIPVVVVTPGEHTLTLELNNGEDTPEKITLTGTFEAGKRYRIKHNVDGALKIIEDEDDRHKSGVMY